MRYYYEVKCWHRRILQTKRPLAEHDLDVVVVVCFLSRTPRPTTAGCRRWAPTAWRGDAFTSGFLNWFCKNAEGSTARYCIPTQTGRPIGVQMLKNWRIRRWPGVNWAVRTDKQYPTNVPFGNYSETAREDETGFQKICLVQKIQSRFHIVFTLVSKTKSKLLVGASQCKTINNRRSRIIGKKHVHTPNFYLEDLRNAVMKPLCPAFL